MEQEILKVAREIVDSHKRVSTRALSGADDTEAAIYASRQEAYRNGLRRAFILIYGHKAELKLSDAVADGLGMI